jgi:hypothetical protein
VKLSSGLEKKSPSSPPVLSPVNSMNLQIPSSFLMIANKRPDQLTVSADRNNKFRARSFFFFWAPRLSGSHIAPKVLLPARDRYHVAYAA